MRPSEGEQERSKKEAIFLLVLHVENNLRGWRGWGKGGLLLLGVCQIFSLTLSCLVLSFVVAAITKKRSGWMKQANQTARLHADKKFNFCKRQPTITFLWGWCLIIWNRFSFTSRKFTLVDQNLTFAITPTDEIFLNWLRNGRNHHHSFSLISTFATFYSQKETLYRNAQKMPGLEHLWKKLWNYKSVFKLKSFFKKLVHSEDSFD
jgi:hypothetical protein